MRMPRLRLRNFDAVIFWCINATPAQLHGYTLLLLLWGDDRGIFRVWFDAALVEPPGDPEEDLMAITEKGWDPPKHCPDCRRERRVARDLVKGPRRE